MLLIVDWTYPCDHQFLTNVYARNMVDRGHRITWVMRPRESGRDDVRRETWNGSDVYVLPDDAFDPVRNVCRWKTGRIETNPIFSTDVDFDEIDVIHVRNDLSMGLAAKRLAETRDLPFAHQISHLKAETMIEESRLGLRGPAARAKGHLGRHLRRRVSESADVVLPISEAMKRHLERTGYDVPMEVLPTGATSEAAAPDRAELASMYGLDRERYLIYLGSMAPIRRLEFLFDVLEIVREDHDVGLLMVGGRSAENVDRLREAAAKAGVSADVAFTGWIDDREEIRRAISTADVGLSPLPTDSVLRTNAPIKTLEYMGLGTPVVATSTPDQRSVLDDSDAGIAVRYDPGSFSEAIDELLSSPSRRRRMSERGREWISEHRNFEALTRRTERLYRRIVSP